MDKHGSAWISMDQHGSAWISMDQHYITAAIRMEDATRTLPTLYKTIWCAALAISSAKE